MTKEALDKMDEEANYFARCLLVPESLLRKELDKRGGTFDIGDDDQLKELAKLFQVSMAVMAIRIFEIKSLRKKRESC